MMTHRSAFSGQRSAKHLRAASRDRGFSLIEVLLAIFILGIGVISITALFPAGIAQQRLSVDDMNGPIVANNAIEIIRGKVRQEDFGTFEQFGILTANTPRPTVPGDWTWLRPAFLFADDGTWPPAPAPPLNETGAIDLFSWYAFNNSGNIPGALRATEFPAEYVSGSGLYGIPFNTSLHSSGPPRIIITREERYYPMTPRMFSTNNDVVRPQYVWDCAFRRYQGKVMVAIFVYRVTVPGGGAAPNYTVAQNGNVPPLPVWLNLVSDPSTGTSPPPYCAAGAWDSYSQVGVTPANPAVVFGVEDGVQYNPDDPRHAWQHPRQWMVDQNNSVHRVLGHWRENFDSATGNMEVELVRPVTPVMGRIDPSTNLSLPMGTGYYYRPTGATNPDWPQWQYRFVNTDVVTDIWYVPLVDVNGLTLTPVYATVKEL